MGDKAGHVIGAGIDEPQEFIVSKHSLIYPFSSFRTVTGQKRLVLLPDVGLSLQPALGDIIGASLPIAALPVLLWTRGAKLCSHPLWE